jgi:hypothetical protein
VCAPRSRDAGVEPPSIIAKRLIVHDSSACARHHIIFDPFAADRRNDPKIGQVRSYCGKRSMLQERVRAGLRRARDEGKRSAGEIAADVQAAIHRRGDTSRRSKREGRLTSGWPSPSRGMNSASCPIKILGPGRAS